MDRDRRPQPGADHISHQIMVRIDDVAAHFAHARSRGAAILQDPVDHVFGERQYVARDIGGHRWTFSQTLADADPKDWGGDVVVLKSG
ncbi:MAG: VOC family protein [Acidobacteriota bacterium]